MREAERALSFPGMTPPKASSAAVFAAMTGLVTNLQIKRPDEFFEALMTAHRELDDDQSRLLNAKLILLLANHIGDEAVLMEAIKAAGRHRAGSGRKLTDNIRERPEEAMTEPEFALADFSAPPHSRTCRKTY